MQAMMKNYNLNLELTWVSRLSCARNRDVILILDVIKIYSHVSWRHENIIIFSPKFLDYYFVVHGLDKLLGRFRSCTALYLCQLI